MPFQAGCGLSCREQLISSLVFQSGPPWRNSTAKVGGFLCGLLIVIDAFFIIKANKSIIRSMGRIQVFNEGVLGQFRKRSPILAGEESGKQQPVLKKRVA